ncbi:uncharacterized protein PpBr36_10072 [Pyricularia pennisetigena]|uniref:uncharacterized protein n=1 Tax=Pyricularia pennisetigena TaxID=1578925 RepID=UPI00114F5219|nr:uncharacterized protein PpBr36_10072 [Pyricularia pennisetigena]TLS22253.1 hypothetical protein PpBr36_10072 [Pyricularia pennisetigena]
MVKAEPRTWPPMRTARTWVRVRVASSIMPKPTPWMLSSRPSHSHRQREMTAPATGLPIQGRYMPMPDTPHSIWAQRGAASPMASMGSSHVCSSARRLSAYRITDQRPSRKKMASSTTPQPGMNCDEKRKAQLLLDDDHGEEARHDLAAGQRDVKPGDGVGGLPVEVGQAEVDDDADGPEDEADGDADDDGAGHRRGPDEAGHRVRAVGDQGAPVPEAERVDLREARDHEGARHPLPGRGAALVAKVERERDGAVAGPGRVKGRRGVLQRAPDLPLGDEGRHAQAEEGQPEEEPGNRERVHALEVARHEEPDERRRADDLVRVDGDDLAEDEEEGVDGPVADAAGEEPRGGGMTRRRLVSIPKQKLIVRPGRRLALVRVVDNVQTTPGRAPVTGPATTDDARVAAVATPRLRAASARRTGARAARVARDAQLGVAVPGEPLLLALLEEGLDAHVGGGVLSRQVLVQHGAELVVELLVAVGEVLVHFLQLEVVPLAHHVLERQHRAVARLLVEASRRRRRHPQHVALCTLGLRPESRAVRRHDRDGRVAVAAGEVRPGEPRRAQPRRVVGRAVGGREAGAHGRRAYQRPRLGRVGAGRGRPGRAAGDGRQRAGVAHEAGVGSRARGRRAQREEAAAGAASRLLPGRLLVVDADGLVVERVDLHAPLRDGEALLGRPRPHLRALLGLALEGRRDGVLELVQQMLGAGRLDRVPETGHLTQTTDPGADAEGALPAELDGHQAKGLVARRDQGELGTGEDVRRQRGELGLAEDAAGVLLHQLLQLERGELAVQVDDGTDGDELRLGVPLQHAGEDVGDQVHALLQRPAADKHKQVRVRVDVEPGPLLSLPPEVAALGLGLLVDLDVLGLLLLLLRLLRRVPVVPVGRVRVGQLPDVLETPEDGVAGQRAVAVLLGHADGAEAALVQTEVAGARVQQVEDGAVLDVLRHDLGREPKHLAHLLALLGRPHGPETLELGVVQREADGDGLREQVQRRCRPVVVVDVVDVRAEAADGLGDAAVPGRVEDAALDIVHARDVRVGLGLGPEDGRVQDHVRDVLVVVVLHLHLVRRAHDVDKHGLGRRVDGVLDVAHHRHHPDEVAVRERSAHELGHDAETTDLDGDLPVVNVVLHGRDEDLSALAVLACSSRGATGSRRERDHGRRGDGGHLHAHALFLLLGHEVDAGQVELEGETLLLAEARLVDLDLVETCDVDPSRHGGHDDGPGGEQEHEDDLDGDVSLGNARDGPVGVVELDLPRPVRHRGRAGDVDDVVGERAGRETVGNAIAVDVAVDEAGVGLAVRVDAPDVELELGRPLVEEVLLPDAGPGQGHGVEHTGVVAPLVEGPVEEDVRQPARRAPVQVAVLHDGRRAERRAVVLHHDVQALPRLLGRSLPRHGRDGLGVLARVGLPRAPLGAPVGAVPPLGRSRRRVRDAHGVLGPREQAGGVVGVLRPDHRVVELAEPEEEHVAGRRRCRPALGRRVLHHDLVDAVGQRRELGRPEEDGRHVAHEIPLGRLVDDAAGDLGDSGRAAGSLAVLARGQDLDGLGDGVAVGHLDREFQPEIQPPVGIRRVERAVVPPRVVCRARNEAGDHGCRLDKEAAGHVRPVLVGLHGDAADAAGRRTAREAVLDGRALEREGIRLVEQVDDLFSAVERRHKGNMLGLGVAVKRIRLLDGLVVVDEPDVRLRLVGLLRRRHESSSHAPDAKLGGRGAAAQQLEARLVRELLDEPAVLQRRDLLAQAEHVLHHVAQRRRGVAVVEAHRHVVATGPALLDRPVHVHFVVFLVAGMLHPGRRGRECLTTKHVVLGRRVEHVKLLLLAVKYQRRAWQQHRDDEEAQVPSLCALFDSWPSENVLHIVPKRRPVISRQIVPCLEIALETQELGEIAVDRVVEGAAVQCAVALLPEEVLLVGRSLQVERGGQVGLHVGLATTAEVDGSQHVAGGDLADHQEVVLAHLLGTLTHGGAPLGLRVERHLHGLVDTVAVKVQHLDGQARKYLEPRHDGRLPLAETVLDRGELGQLTLPVGEDTKRFDVSILVKVAVVAALEL